MRRPGPRALIGATAAYVAILAAGGAARAASSEVRIEWVKEYGSDAGWLELEAAAWRKTDLVLAVNAHVPNTDVNRRSLLRIDSEGRELGRVDVPPSYVVVRALAVGGAGEHLFAVADAPVDHPWLLRLDPALGVRAEHRLGKDKENELTVLRLIPATGGRFAVAGHELSRGVTAIVDTAGEPTQPRGASAGQPRGASAEWTRGASEEWPEKRIEPKVSVVRDGVSAGDGGLVLVGNSIPAGAEAPTSVWVGKLDGAGNVVKERTLEGRHGRIVRAQAPGAYAVLYDESTSKAQKIRLRVMNADLQDVSTTAVLDVGEGYQEFELATWGNGFLVAGGKDDRPWFAAVSADGKLGTPTWAEAMSPSEKYELVSADGTGFVASSVFVEFTDSAGKRQATQMVRVIKLRRDAA